MQTVIWRDGSVRAYLPIRLLPGGMVQVRILRGISLLALLLAVVWFGINPDFEPIITAILGLGGFISAGLADPKRFKSDDIAVDQSSIPVRVGSKVQPSVAVLPLRNLSSDPDDEFFSDGMTEDVITHLSKIHALKVISRTSCMLYKNRELPLKGIAAELGVDHVLEGSVRRDKGRLRVVAQLVDARDDHHVWADTFDRDLTDVFQVQSEIAQSIAVALRARLSEGERKRIEAVPTDNLEAYNLCLLGRHFWNRWTEPDILQSTEYFAQAIEKDPDYARAHCELGVAWATLALGYWSFRPLDVYPKGAAALERALKLGPDQAQAHAWMGLIKQWYELNWLEAEASFSRAIELDPNSASAHDSLGWWLTSVGRHGEAEGEYNRALDLDPLSLFTTCNAALGAYRARDYERSVELFDRAIALDPNLPMAHGLSSLVHVKSGDRESALGAAERGDRLSQGSTPFLAMRAYVQAACGEDESARRVLEELDGRREEENVWLFGLGMIHAALGDHDLAFRILNEAIEERVGWVTYLAVEPSLDNLRSDPRFEDLLKKAGWVSAGGLSPPI